MLSLLKTLEVLRVHFKKFSLDTFEVQMGLEKVFSSIQIMTGRTR